MSHSPQGELVDHQKVRAALDALYTAGYSRGLAIEQRVPAEYWVMFVALHSFGCIGHWPDIGPLKRVVHAWPEYFGGTEGDASSLFDAMLDWVLGQTATTD